MAKFKFDAWARGSKRLEDMKRTEKYFAPSDVSFVLSLTAYGIFEVFHCS